MDICGHCILATILFIFRLGFGSLNNCESLENTVISLFSSVSLTTSEQVLKHKSPWNLTGYSLLCVHLPIHFPSEGVTNHKRNSSLVLPKNVWGNMGTWLLCVGCMWSLLHVTSTVSLLFRLGSYSKHALFPSVSYLWILFLWKSDQE